MENTICNVKSCNHYDAAWDRNCKNFMIINIEQCYMYKQQNKIIKTSEKILNIPNTKEAPKTDYTDNKPDYSLIPIDLICEMLEPAYKEGIHPTKYYRESWRLGFSMLRIYASVIRHLIAFVFKHEDFDPDAEKLGIKKHHLGGAMFALICMYDTWKNHKEKDNRSIYQEWRNK